MALRVRSEERNVGITQCARNPDRSVFGIVEVGATTRVRRLGDVRQGDELAFLRVDNGNLVGLVGRCEEVALGSVPATVVQELGCADVGYAMFSMSL